MNEFKSAIDRRLADVRMDEAMKRRILKKVEEDSMKKRYKFSGALLVAVLLALALAATGLAAAARWGLIDFFGDAAEPILSNEQVKEQIRTDLGSASDDDIRLTLREAIFDGYGLQLLLDVAPTDPSKLTLSASNADAGGETATTSTSGHLEITDDPAVTLFTSGIIPIPPIWSPWRGRKTGIFCTGATCGLRRICPTPSRAPFPCAQGRTETPSPYPSR